MEKYSSFSIQTILEIAHYNSELNNLKRLFNDIIGKINKNEEVIKMPEWLKKYHPNHLMRVVWSILVIECGDYETSPWFGWIYNDESIIDIIREVIDWEDYEEKYLEE